jgi:hypothetical protein
MGQVAKSSRRRQHPRSEARKALGFDVDVDAIADNSERQRHPHPSFLNFLFILRLFWYPRRRDFA